MRAISASEFRQQCLALIDKLPAEGILVTRRGHPIAKLMPVGKSSSDLIGSVPGIVIDPEDDLLSTALSGLLNLEHTS